MQFKHASIQNFKLLRDVRLQFSTDPTRPLTIIRAENGCGKTSTMAALEWCLFGEKGLEAAARDVRLSASEWPDGKRCPIRVEVDFTHTTFDEMGGEFVATVTDYRIIRSVDEVPKGNEFERGTEEVRLYHLTSSGAEEIKGAEAKIAEMLPIEMEDVFFTDGDKAMNFISPSLSKKDKQDQVNDSIRSLLGLGLLESALGHIKKAGSTFERQLARATGSEEAQTVYEGLETAKQERDQAAKRVAELEEQIRNLQQREDEADRKLMQALKDTGDPGELARSLEKKREERKEAETTELSLKRQHQSLLSSDELSWALMGGLLRKGVDVLSALRDKGVIPSASIPVLQDRLDLGECICGASLSAGTEARRNVESLMVTQKQVDEEKEALTALFHRAKLNLQQHEEAADRKRDWLHSYQDLGGSRLAHKKLLEGLENEIKVLEDKIARVDEQAIDTLRKQRDAYRADKTRKQSDRTTAEIAQRQRDAEVAKLETDWEKIRKATKENAAIKNKITVCEDLGTVVEQTLGRLQTDYLKRVSDRMNDLFLQMVGADPNAAGGVFKGAEITSDYDIQVLTADGRTLDPDHELNGASKRALTLAFIWSLTDVSGVIAPRVIDTPLGMMSGGVKRRVVEMVSDPQEATRGYPDKERAPAAARELQVVLFLTRQEILMVEDLIDQRAGEICTYTNSAGFPIDLVKDPGLDRPEIRACSCNHRQKCDVCSRKDDDQYALSVRKC